MKITREAKIGIFAVTCIAVLFWGVNFLKGKNVFSRTNTYYAVFKRVDGLKNTNDIILSGYKVGYVKSIRFEEGNTGNLIINAQIGKKYQVPHNSIIKLVSADLMGGKALRLELAPNKTFHDSGDTLLSSIETGLMDQVIYEMVPIKEKAEVLMEDLANVLKTFSKVFNESNIQNINHSFESLRSSMESIDSISASMNTMMSSEHGKIPQIVDNVNQISQNLKNSNEDISKVIKNFSSVSDSLAKANIAHTLAQADSAILNFSHVLAKINRGEGTVGMLVNNDSLYHNLEQASKNLELLLVDMKANPKRYVNFSVFNFNRDRSDKSE